MNTRKHRSRVSTAVVCPPSSPLHRIPRRAHRSQKSPKKEHRDPVTGDTLTQGEYVSWRVQGIIRRWTFLVVVTLITIGVWATRESVALLWWNLCASYLAIVIESIVGIAMYSQTKRDAQVLREVRAISKRVETLVAREEREIKHLEQMNDDGR